MNWRRVSGAQALICVAVVVVALAVMLPRAQSDQLGERRMGRAALARQIRDQASIDALDGSHELARPCARTKTAN